MNAYPKKRSVIFNGAVMACIAFYAVSLLATPALQVSVSGPSTITTGQKNVVFKVDLRNTGTEDLENLKVTFPLAPSYGLATKTSTLIDENDFGFSLAVVEGELVITAPGQVLYVSELIDLSIVLDVNQQISRMKARNAVSASAMFAGTTIEATPVVLPEITYVEATKNENPTLLPVLPVAAKIAIKGNAQKEIASATKVTAPDKATPSNVAPSAKPEVTPAAVVKDSQGSTATKAVTVAAKVATAPQPAPVALVDAQKTDVAKSQPVQKAIIAQPAQLAITDAPKTEGVISRPVQKVSEPAKKAPTDQPVQKVIVAQPAQLVVSALSTPSKGHAHTGTISIKAQGGTPPLSYSLNAGASFQSSNVFTKLGQGTFKAMVRDATGRMATTAVTVGRSK